MLKGIFAPKLITILVLMATYAGLLVYLLFRAKIWTTDLAGETIFWFFGPALVLFLKVDEANKHPHFFRRAFVSLFTLTVVIEFVVNFYPLNLIAEVLLVPVFVVLGGTLAVAASRPEYRQVKAFLQFVLGAVGVFFLGYAAFRVVMDPHAFATLGTVREFIVPLMLTVGFLPFIYVVAVLFAYSTMFVRLRWTLEDDQLRRYAKRRALQAGLLRLRTVRRLGAGYPAGLVNASSRSDVDRAAREIKRGRRR